MRKALLDALDVTVHIEQFALKEGERSVTATVSGTKHSLAHAASVPGGLQNNAVRISDRGWWRERNTNRRGGVPASRVPGVGLKPLDHLTSSGDFFEWTRV